MSKLSSLFGDVKAYRCDAGRQNAVNLGRRRGPFGDGSLSPRELSGSFKIRIISKGK